jgi:hypothetical protein
VKARSLKGFDHRHRRVAPEDLAEQALVTGRQMQDHHESPIVSPVG